MGSSSLAELSVRAEPLRHWLDDLWDEYLPARTEVHRFTKEELQLRFIQFGLWMSFWMTILGLLAVAAVLKRLYGSFGKAWEILKGMSWRERVRVILLGRDPNPNDSDSEQELPLLSVRIVELQDVWCGGGQRKSIDADAEALWRLSNDMVNLDSGLTEEERAMYQEKMLKQRMKSNAELGDLEPVTKSKTDDSAAEGDFPFLSPRERKEALLKKHASQDLTHQEELLELEQQLQQEQGVPASSERLQRLKIPISVALFIGYIVICAAIPFLNADKASCTQGLPWEVHMTFFHFFILVKFWEVYLLAFDTSIPGKISLMAFMVKFGSSFLGFFDGYSDSNAILIAHACGSDLWHWMAICYFIGVILLQWILLGFLSLMADTSNTCFFKMLHMDALAECSAMKPTDTWALPVWRLVNLFRFMFEDLPQSICQTIFVLTVKRNPVMILSIVIGICTSAAAIYAAFRRVAFAVGTNLKSLEAISEMQKCMDQEDEKGFFKAYEKAVKSGANTDLLEEKCFLAEEKFKFLSTDSLPRVMANKKNPSSALRKAADGADKEDAYYRRRQSLEFALRAAKRRSKERKQAEKDLFEENPARDCAKKRGTHDECRHVCHIYAEERSWRTMAYAKKAQNEREARLKTMVKAGDGICHGSRPKKSGERADARCPKEWSQVEYPVTK
eukprot:TRINITY_DN29199_c0_g1_i2.p1 TRINITY_DN29199_c0_g1~~TRINITY_DN29199_c0_g1_i2.p1  ORF type:complete len:675 (-),score=166.45 TRINITY_DN29199_c0_g1_i2:127-2151(-)